MMHETEAITLSQTPEAECKSQLYALKDELQKRGVDCEITSVEPYQDEYYCDPTAYLIGGDGEEVLSIRVKSQQPRRVVQIVVRMYPQGSSIDRIDGTITIGEEQIAYVLTILEERSNQPWTLPVFRKLSRTIADICNDVIESADYREKFKVAVTLPTVAKQAARLKAIADSKLSNDFTVVRVIDPVFVGNMPKTEQDILQEDLKHLSDANLLWHFARNDKGQFERGKDVVLATYPASLEGKYLSRSVWLAVDGPERAADKNLIVYMRNTTGENFEHQWWQERWMWDTRARRGDLYLAWEINDKEKAHRCFELLTQGKIVEALEMYDIELEPQLQLLSVGIPVSLEHKEYTKTWAPRLVENLMRSAPWRFALLLAREKQCREAWVKLKSSRKYEAKPISLFGLGGVQTTDRPQVFLTSKAGGKMQLILEWSGTQITAPYFDWRRPIDYDLLHAGLITEANIP
jgi:hypothetical protein